MFRNFRLVKPFFTHLRQLCMILLFLLAFQNGYGQTRADAKDIAGLEAVPDTLAPIALNPSDYRIENGFISEEMLHRYLKRALAMQVAAEAPYPHYCGHSNTGEEFACWMEFAQYLRPKYVQFAGLELDNCWKFNGVCDHLFFPGDPKAIGQFKRAIDILHKTVDSQIICEASIIEFMPMQYRKGDAEVKIPDWVKAALPELPALKDEQIFDRNSMVFRHSNEKGADDAFIDITKPVSLAWYYYLATMYIDFGYEALKFCQINRTGENDRMPKVSPSRNFYWTNYLFTKLRNYAKQKGRRGFVLINSQTHGHYVGDPANRQLLLDFHVGPIGIQATDTSTAQSGFTAPGTSVIGGRLAKGNGLTDDTDYEAQIGLHSRDLLLYNNSLGGRHPMGWETRRNPFLVELDCFGGYLGGTHPPLRKKEIWQAWAPWAWDEATWLVHQSEAYRRQFMLYAYHRVRCLDDFGYIQFAAIRPYRVGPGASWYWYRAYDCEGGFKDAAVIKNLWDGNEAHHPETHKYYNRWAHAFATVTYNDRSRTPRGKCHFGDFNGDGQPDILETADTSKGQSWSGWRMYLMQDSTYSLYKADTSAEPGHYYVGDFDGDGKDDFLLTPDNNQGSGSNAAVIYSSSTAFRPMATGGAPWRTDQLYVGDFNGDGKDDLLATAAPSLSSAGWDGFKIYTSSGTGFTLTIHQNQLSWKDRFYIGDFNGDGRADIMATANDMVDEQPWGGYKVYHSVAGGFEQKAYGKWPSFTERLVVQDWNGDGHADFTAMANGSKNSRWFGSKTYFSNYRGDHFIYAFDFNDLGVVPDRDYNNHHKTNFIPFTGSEPYLIRHNGTTGAEEIQVHRVLHCDGSVPVPGR